jgi:cation diffusion facilitator CzcD-associated flavoprotein CzcO
METVAIIGAGISGIAAAHECIAQGVSFVVFEMDDKVGGTWNTQQFPGIRADSLHIQNLFSFYPLPSDTITTGPWLQNYLEDVVKAYDFFDKIRFQTKVIGVNWDSASAQWELTTQDCCSPSSAPVVVRSRFLVNANGYFDLHRPNIPKQFHEAKFKGTMMHSANMKSVHHEDLTGKAVVLIGSGATATTMVPELLKTVTSLTWVFRSPSHTVPIFRLPGPLAQFHNWLIRLHNNGTPMPYQVYRFVFLSWIQGYMQAMSNYLPKSVVRFVYTHWNGTQTDSFEKFFKPDYEFGQQRICLVDNISATMNDPKLRIIKGEVASIRDRSICVRDANNGGEELTVDGIESVVLCTGYDLSYFKFTVSIDGKPLHMPNQVLRREFLFERIPNLFFLCMFNRLTPVTTSSNTPGLEIMCKMLCRMVKYVESRRLKSFKIREEDPRKVAKLLPMTANYIQRNRDKCFMGVKTESNDACRWHYMFWERPLDPAEYHFD